VLAAALLLATGLPGCVGAGEAAPAPARGQRDSPRSDDVDAVAVHVQSVLPSAGERQCAWFGERGGDILYFGQSAFWWALRRSDGDPRAVLKTRGPRRIGRFDLSAERMLDPLDVAPRRLPRSGVWDVLPAGDPTDRVYFTTYFDAAGVVDLATREVTQFRAAGPLLNELAAGPAAGELLVTRYADAESGGGAVLILSADGAVLSELPLRAPEGEALAAKSAAWDPVAGEIWVTTDRLPLPGVRGGEARPTLVLARDGTEVARFGTPDDPTEIQFVRFAEDGHGAIAWVREHRLELQLLAPESDRRRIGTAVATGVGTGLPIVLEDEFPDYVDFAQDIQIAPDGAVVVTRWSGRVHVVSPTGRVSTIDLPPARDGLYYTGVVSESEGSARRLCTTLCDAVEVVCANVAPPR